MRIDWGMNKWLSLSNCLLSVDNILAPIGLSSHVTGESCCAGCHNPQCHLSEALFSELSQVNCYRHCHSNWFWWSIGTCLARSLPKRRSACVAGGTFSLVWPWVSSFMSSFSDRVDFQQCSLFATHSRCEVWPDFQPFWWNWTRFLAEWIWHRTLESRC